MGLQHPDHRFKSGCRLELKVPFGELFLFNRYWVGFTIQNKPCFAGFTTCGGSHPRHLLIRPSAIPRRDFYVTGNFGEIFCQKTSEKPLYDFPEVFYYMNVQNQLTSCYIDIPKLISKNIKAMVILFLQTQRLQQYILSYKENRKHIHKRCNLLSSSANKIKYYIRDNAESDTF